MNDRIAELEAQVKQYKQVLDARFEARFGRWVENIGFLMGVATMFLAMFDVPWFNPSGAVLWMVVALMVVPKIFGKTVAIDLIKPTFTKGADLISTLGGRDKE